MKFYVNRSNQPENVCPDGTHNERDEMQKVAGYLAEALIRCGQEVRLGTGMNTGIAESNAWPADVHVPIHSNACSTHTATGPRVFYGSAEAEARAVWKRLSAVVGGQVVEPTRHTEYKEINSTKAQCIYIECFFHDNAAEHEAMMRMYPEIAEAICQGLCDAYGLMYVPPVAVLDEDPSADPPTMDHHAWADKAVVWGKETGIFRGDGNGNYRWLEPPTREELAVALFRLYEYLNK